MRIGVSISSTHENDGPARMIERARTAHAAGFASLTIGDHHNMSTRYAQNTPMLGRLLAEWPDRPAGCLFLVPLWHPLLMAEHIGTLAAMHAGPFIVQTGIGSGAAQFAAFGRTERTRGVRLEQAIPLVQRLLAGDTVDDPEFDMTGAHVGLRPDGPVDWWMGAGVDAALERAARLGDVWYAEPRLDLATAAARLDRYRTFGGERATLRRDVLVLSDGDEARRIAEELVARGYRGLGLDQLVVGSVDDAAEELQRFHDLGFEEIVVRCMTVPQEQALETLELLGTLAR